MSRRPERKRVFGDEWLSDFVVVQASLWHSDLDHKRSRPLLHDHPLASRVLNGCGTGEEMEKLIDYYFDGFGTDLDRLIGTDVPRWFGGTWRTAGCTELKEVAANNRPAYLACLYYSVLFDQGLCHHAHAEYKQKARFRRYPKFCPGFNRGHMNPRGILRFPMRWGLVSPEELKGLAAPAANLFVAEYIGIIGEHFPKLDLSNFFYLLTRFPEVEFWSPRVTRRFSEEVRVEHKFLAEMLAAIRFGGF
jgi:hypothetical protein